jgi:hypothetical protein
MEHLFRSNIGRIPNGEDTQFLGLWLPFSTSANANELKLRWRA